MDIHGWARISRETRIDWTVDPHEVVLTFDGPQGFELLADAEALRHLIRECGAALAEFERENAPQAGQ
ncbi:hypothetical protein [Saccharothrix coeruleofusca]|uniref:Uncharacterized protein n=1 Tax=Saccharothrix coeruleofusca TaxID=33919 RepID=A0A918AM45_9PSEU|nr:hypothetical protein [Saccharothrix coeruleofusca]MBP2340771.1 hypothetical protein [Saccharothrix coeruleofusca]GGP59697.1 hypothetical protein GCM10010185_35100 [Saccharothrix coeruleofusca]